MPAVQLDPRLATIYPLGTEVDARGRLRIGGCDALELAREFGTPAYFVVEDDLRTRAQAFVEAFRAASPTAEVVFASKAFPCTAVYRVLAEEGIGCDVASAGELASALRGGFAPRDIHLHGNAKTEEELAYAVEARVREIVVDNADEIDRLERILAERDARQRVLIRVAPGVSPDTHPSISTGGPNTKFGFNPEAARDAIARLRASERIDLEGIHFHIGSQIMELAPFGAALRAVSELGDFGTYNLGGGLGVQYTVDGPQPPSIEEYASAKVRLVEEVFGPGKRVIDEPGRALTARSTVTLYTVQSVKRNVVTWVAVDGGMSDNLRPMLYDARYEIDVVDRMTGPQPSEDDVVAHVTGKHCESGDLLVRDARLNAPRVGDVLVTPVTGAYGHAMANTYNGSPRPPVIFVSGGDARVVVRRETREDLFARDV
ncbi:diaminopimelate decarboxylase [Paraconexibacter antarcticus]|uniref:Diaminopimelate decarboxylase n=1 Tax=Paraconexibacter antarcticus TaxID=2949664 RepID=A0ABY5DX12_9ACTN|nr:diaminopimelate decarboxylase [Paraconexibacter antarcticus]UTI66563.1 diaminopimelate decarboxylase [Paraconexibacter antarcticus]